MATTQAPTTIKCPKCGAVNRVDPEKIARGEAPVCGRCKTALPVDQATTTPEPFADARPITVTDDTFAEQVERSPLPVLLDLWAPWCAPCRALAPTLDQLASEMSGKVRIAKINIDENQKTALRFNASSIPLLLVLKQGREVDRLVGVQPKAVIAARLAKHLS